MKITNKTLIPNEHAEAFVQEMALNSSITECVEIEFTPSTIGVAFVVVDVKGWKNGVTLMNDDFNYTTNCLTFNGYRIARLLGDWAKVIGRK